MSGVTRARAGAARALCIKVKCLCGMQAAQDEARAARVREAAFLRACTDGDEVAVAALLEDGADVRCTDERGACGLHLAAARGRAALVTFLAQRGADCEQEDRDGRTPLHAAALGAQLGAVEALLAHGAWVEAADGGDATALMLAAAAPGGGAVVRRLLVAGARRDAADKRGLRPLARAVANDQEEACSALMEAGAQPDDSLVPPAAAAAGAMQPHLFSLLHLAASLGAQRCARLLLAAGVSPSGAENPPRLTPLHAAALAGRPETLSLLLAVRGYDVNARTAWGAVRGPLFRSGQTHAPPCRQL